MHPDLKYLYVQMTKEYYMNRKSEKWRKLSVRFRKERRKAIKGINYNQFADQLIQGTKSNFYKQIKKVGGMKVPNKKMFISSLVSSVPRPAVLRHLPGLLPGEPGLPHRLPPCPAPFPGGGEGSIWKVTKTKEN